MVGNDNTCQTSPYLMKKKRGVIFLGGQPPLFEKNGTLGIPKVYLMDELEVKSVSNGKPLVQLV